MPRGRKLSPERLERISMTFSLNAQCVSLGNRLGFLFGKLLVIDGISLIDTGLFRRFTSYVGFDRLFLAMRSVFM